MVQGTPEGSAGRFRTDYRSHIDNRGHGRLTCSDRHNHLRLCPVQRGGTTGYLLPEHDKALALGFVKIEYSNLGTEIGIKIRHNVIKAIVRDRKFMNKKYVK